MIRHPMGLALLLALLARPSDGGVQEPAARPQGPAVPQTKLDGDPARRLEQYKQAAAHYAIERHSEPPATLTLKPEPIFRWNSPLRTAYDGVIFVWTADGRPEVMATFYRNIRDGAIYEQHEFQSLSAAGVTASYDGRRVWDTHDPGLTLAPIPGAPKPAATPAARLRQMRDLADEFRAEVIEGRKVSPLRLLKQPLYRFEPAGGDRGDGAVFGLVHATDPEALLVIESRTVDGGPAWHRGFARMTGFAVRARHKDEVVWETRPVTANGPYTRIPAPEQPR